MWLEQAEELFKGYLPYYVLIFLPIFIIVSPANPVSASHEFPVYRMQHYDLHGVAYGCRSAGINLEARSISTWSTSRHCIVTRFIDLTIEHFNNIKSKGGALVVMLPESITNLTRNEKEHIRHLENSMLSQETSIPVYFSPWTSSLNFIVTEIAQSKDTQDLKTSAASALFSSVAANGYQIVIPGGTPSVKADMKIGTFHGHLSGYSSDGIVPTIAIVAHYDSFGVAPDLSFGADSNGSGVLILLELVRLFSGMYNDPKSRGKYNIIFVLSGGGKVNFQGSKKWLEDQLDSVDGTLIQDAAYVMCLDTLAASNSLYMHVSKPPKEGSAAFALFKELKGVAEKFQNVTVEGVHKKINLADDILAWEHERYSIRRLPAFTISSLKSHKDLQKYTILDTKQNVNVDKLVHNTKIISEAVGRLVFNLPGGDIFGGSWDVNREYMEAWLNILTSQARSPQLLSTKDNVLVKALYDNFNKHLRDVKVTYAVPDRRDPDFQFYGNSGGVMNVYSVKPAVFDLIVTLAIILYLGLVYFFIHYFSHLYLFSCKLMQNKKVKSS